MEIENSIRSEEVQDIMERMPKRFIKWGSSVIFLLIFLLIVLSAIIQYPDTINGTALLTTQDPPVAVTAKNNGNIEKLFVTDKSHVLMDEPMAVIRNRTNYQTVLWMDSLLNEKHDSSNIVNSETTALDYNFWAGQKNRFEELGDLTSSFSSFLRSLKEYKLATDGKIPLEEALHQTSDKKVYDKAWSVVTQREYLRMSIISWKDRYLLKSPATGQVSFPGPWSENQVIRNTEEFCKVIPDKKNIICKVLISTAGSAKVKEEQRVRIVLASYPENEFGFLDGKVLSVSSVPMVSEEGSNYLVTVSVPVPLVTSIKKQVEYMPEMQGTAEIITQRKTILARLTEIFLSYWNKQS